MLRNMMSRARNTRKLWPRVASNSISNSTQSPVKYQIYSQVNELQKSTWSSESTHSTSSSLLPLCILTFLGVGVSGLLEPAYAQEPVKPDILENKASHERRRLEELIKSKGSHRGAYPQFTVTSRGENITIKFKIPPKCDVSQLIIDLVSHLGLKAESQDDISSEMLIRAWENAAAWQVTLTYPNLANETSKTKDNLCVFMYESLVGPEFCEIEFIKNGSFSDKELEALASVMKLAGGLYAKSPTVKNPRASKSRKEVPIEKSVSELEAMGVRVYGLDETSGVPLDVGMSWDNLAGYEEQKREIEDTILLALQRPEIYDDIARGTRRKFESNRPKAVLFEGPPGTGKTSSARVIAKQAGVPLLYVPLEVIMSKYYGESERLLGNVFKLADDLPNGALVFLDEVDSFAIARDSEMHEATRRILSVLLRQIDGFEQEKQVVVIAATNRKDDLDPALISRFDSIICFDLPDQKTRKEIVSQYAKHLDESDMVKFAEATENMSGRDIRDVCQQAERHWASKLIRGIVPFDSEGKNLPPIDEYIKCAEQRQRALLKTDAEANTEANSGWRWKPRALA